MPTLQEVHERVVKLHGPQSPVALAIAQQLEAEKANKGRSAASLFVEGGYGHMLHEKNPPRKDKNRTGSDCENRCNERSLYLIAVVAPSQRGDNK